MENLDFRIRTDQNIAKYDLKGSETNRFVKVPRDQNGNSKTLQDNNFVIDQNGEPICLPNEQYDDLMISLENDCEFLASVNIVDYSALLIINKA